MSFGAMPSAPVKVKMLALHGGLDLVSPTSVVKPGECIDAANFIQDLNGGYRRIEGYERYDGRPSPSDATYHIVTVAGLGSAAVGNTLSGASASAIVIAVPGDGTLVVSKLSGSYAPSETLTISGSPVGTFTSISEAGATELVDDVTYQADAADLYRADIAAVPGSGDVLGLHWYKEKLYAWRNDAGGTAAVMYVSSASGWQAVAGVPALLPGGRVNCITHNFTGAAGAEKMYGADGVNKAFQFDGTTYTQITTTASPDTPSIVVAHKNRLFAAILGSLFLSSPGAPTTGWAGVGATSAEIGTGSMITGLVILPGDMQNGALAVYGDRRTSILYGYSSATWSMSVVSPERGATFGTAQYASTAIALDKRVMATLASVQEYGNYASSSVSEKVKPIVAETSRNATTSIVLRTQNQYMVFFDDASGLAVHIDNKRVRGIMPLSFPHTVKCAHSGENSDGVEIAFFGDEQGYVYQFNKGNSFDGQDIEAWFRLAFNHAEGPHMKCSWRRMKFEVNVPEYAEIEFGYDIDYSDEDKASPAAQVKAMTGGGGYWDSFTWDLFVWDTPYRSPPMFKLSGVGSSISPLIYSKSRLSKSFVFETALVHYSPRRLDRRL